MDDDLNIAPALAAVFTFINKMNKIMDEGGISQEDREKIISCFTEINSVIAVFDLEKNVQDKEVIQLVRKREKARKAKDWATSDRIRDELREKNGVEITDTADGTIWRKIN
jgi:cysteinyl-tRNA synthetase